MTPLTCFILMLSLYVATGARVHPVVHPENAPSTQIKKDPQIIQKACEQTHEKETCLAALNNVTNGDVTNMKDATLVSIQAASLEAKSTAELIEAARKREENKEVVEDGIEEETLADCCMTYNGLIEKLAGASSAVSNGPEINVKDDLQEALTTAETCEMSIAGGRKSPVVEQVATKNEHVKKLCSISLSVYEAYAKKPAR